MTRNTVAALLAAFAAATFALSAGAAGPGGGGGPDVLYSGINSQMNHGTVGGIRAYSLGTDTCNIGNQNLLWTFNGTPGVGFNAYRLHNGRLIQLGLSFVKTACCAGAFEGCKMACNGEGGDVLGTGCLDVYHASWNASQSALAARSTINPYGGQFSAFSTATGNAIFKRLQVQQSDITLTNFPGATFFVEGVYIGSDDATSNNRNNNASYRPVSISQTTFDLGLISETFAGQPAITAWRAHGLGLNSPDTSVNLASLDVPNEGRFHYAYKVKDNLDGTWRYEYAVFNLSSDRAAGSFSVPIPPGTVITNAGFSSPDYHSGEVYSNADWLITTAGGSVTWATPQTFAQNPNSSALRWGTMYNFWFDADREPGNAVATLGLFKPHSTQSVALTVSGPILDCPADIVASGSVDIDDLLAVISAWGACIDPKNCPADIAPKGGDDVVNIDDLLTLISAWGPCS